MKPGMAARVLRNPKLPFRRHFLLFLMISTFACAQLAWWVVFQINEGKRISRIQHELWSSEMRVAQQYRQVAPPDEFEPWLRHTFPDLEWVAGDHIKLKATAIAELDDVAGQRVRMFIGEGVFFGLLLLGAVLYMYRTLQEEIITEHRQSVFLSATSHELKTPITSLRIYLDTMVERDLPEAQRREMLEIMRADLTRLSELIERLLQAQKVLAGDRKQNFQVIDLSEETERVVRAYLNRIDRNRYSITYDAEFGIQAHADAERWQLVVRNLLDNALKYSISGGAIDVYLTRQFGKARLTVTDQGQGFDPSQAERIFQRFYRVGDEETRETQGVGLGLYLVREIVESFDGTVKAESQGIGKGAKFTVEFPTAEATSD